MTSARPERILALDVHPLSFGFVILEGPDQLIDWGVRSFRNGVNAVKVPMSKKLDLLFKECQPNALIMKQARMGVSQRMKMIAKLAGAHHLPVRTISRDSIRKAFPESSRNKHETAKAVAGRCPDLAPYLPAKRKPWQSEKYFMSAFEAVALGLTYFRRERLVNERSR
jgi:hypothetical protein